MIAGPPSASVQVTKEFSMTMEHALHAAAMGWEVLPLHSAWLVDCRCSDDQRKKYRKSHAGVPEGMHAGCSCNTGGLCTARLGEAPGKHPVAEFVPRGVTDATTDEKKIRSWYEADPTLNYGIKAGLAALVDIDTEPKDPLPIAEGTPQVATGRGTHYYLQAPEGVTLGGVHKYGEFRHGNGYTVGPGSKHANGSEYLEVVPLVPLDECPVLSEELIAALGAKRRTGERFVWDEKPSDVPRWLVVVTDDVMRRLAAKIEAGEPRHEAMRPMAQVAFGYAATVGTDEAKKYVGVALKEAMELFRYRGDHELTEAEIDDVLLWASEHAPDKPLTLADAAPKRITVHGQRKLDRIAEEVGSADDVLAALTSLGRGLRELYEGLHIPTAMLPELRKIAVKSAYLRGITAKPAKDALEAGYSDALVVPDITVIDDAASHWSNQGTTDRRPAVQLNLPDEPVVWSDLLWAFKETLMSQMYRRETSIVRVDFAARTRELDQVSLPMVLDQSVRCFVTKKVGGTEVEEDRYLPPKWSQRLLSMSDELSLPELVGVTQIPMVRADGTVATEAGYDTESQWLYLPRGLDVPKVSESPTLGEVEEARAIIDGPVLGGFRWAEPGHHVNVVGMFLAPFIKPLVPGTTPLFAVTAGNRGSGKGLISDMLSIIVDGRPLVKTRFDVNDHAELEKRIGAALIAGLPMFCFDNINGPWKSEVLEALITAETYGARLLGKSELIPCPNRTIWITTGNNTTFGGDLGRRVIPIRIDPDSNKPWTRAATDFPTEQPKWTMENRGKVVWALLTMIRAWAAAGMKEGSSLPMGQWTPWTKTISGILENAGYTERFWDVSAEGGASEALDVEDTQWALVAEALFALSAGAKFKAKQLAEWVGKGRNIAMGTGPHPADDVCERLFHSVPEKWQAASNSIDALYRVAGHDLTTRVGRIFAGRWRLYSERDTARGGTFYWFEDHGASASTGPTDSADPLYPLSDSSGQVPRTEDSEVTEDTDPLEFLDGPSEESGGAEAKTPTLSEGLGALNPKVGPLRTSVGAPVGEFGPRTSVGPLLEDPLTCPQCGGVMTWDVALYRCDNCERMVS